jgi:hypothetical protein
MSNTQSNKRFYAAQAESWTLGRSSTGKEQVAISFLVLTEGATHERLTWYGYFTEHTFDRTVETLRTCGWQGDDLSDLSGVEQNKVSLVVVDEDFEGKVTARVAWVNRTGGGPSVKEVLEGNEAKAFAAAMKDRVRAWSAANKSKAPAAKTPASLRTPEPPPHTDEDNLPF